MEAGEDILLKVADFVLSDQPSNNFMSTILSAKIGVKARKKHRCCLCGERINAGDFHDTRTGVGDDGVWTMRMHHECHNYESKKGVVDEDWYEDTTDPAFLRADAIAYTKEHGISPTLPIS